MFRPARTLSRRALLQGLGVTLSLPWLPSLLPRGARAETPAHPKRFLPIFLPNGAHDYWQPLGSGQGDSWRLSSVLEPFGSLKAKLNVISHLENASVFSADASPYVDPSHSRLAGAWLTCVDAVAVRAQLSVGEANGVSIDQFLAAHANFRNQTALPSLQVGLSTALGACDGEPCSSTRSVSWASPSQPMYKLIDPLEVFDALVGVSSTQGNEVGAAEAEKRRARDLSVLDAVLESARLTQTRLGRSDRERLEEFLSSVRATEQRVSAVSARLGGRACLSVSAPTMAQVEQSETSPHQTTATYDKTEHADAMNDLIAMAFECDATRVISYMLEDERSAFTYDHVVQRAFTPEGSSPKGGSCPEYHLAQHMDGDEFASITWWNVGKVADLCRRLDAIEDAPGVSVLDNCVVLFGGCMEGGSHKATRLPVALVGGQNLGLGQNQHLELDNQPLRDLYATLMNSAFHTELSEFGQNLTGAPLGRIPGLLET